MIGKIHINPNGNQVVSGWTIKLNDVDISDFISSLTISTQAGSIPVIDVTVYALPDMPIEIEGEIRAHLVEIPSKVNDK